MKNQKKSPAWNRAFRNDINKATVTNPTKKSRLEGVSS